MGSVICMRRCRREKLGTSPSKATISPSTTKLSSVWEAMASTISGYVPLRTLRFLEKSLTLPPFRKARHRSPSNFGSKSQFGSEKRRSVSVANMGLIHSGCGLSLSRARASGGRLASKSATRVSGNCRLLLIQFLDRPPTQNGFWLLGHRIPRVGILVTFLDEQTDGLFAISNPGQGESAFQLLALQPDS